MTSLLGNTVSAIKKGGGLQGIRQKEGETKHRKKKIKRESDKHSNRQERRWTNKQADRRTKKPKNKKTSTQKSRRAER